ncbi:MAG: hypothetical protein J1F65_02425 [Clostridiales bacterium]|nr:hypothetical protein [Clostridiales bacterium]
MKNAKENGQQVNNTVDLLDILLDRDNTDPIVLQDESGKTLSFAQVAIIPYDTGDERILYAVLKPIDRIEGIADDEAIVFKAVTNENGDTVLRVEEDELRAIDVFDKYYDLLNVEKEELKMIGNFDYGQLQAFADSIEYKLRIFNVRVQVKTIQFGVEKSRLVFEIISPHSIADLMRYELDVKACVPTNRTVKVVAPFGNERQFAAEMDNEQALDPFCKKALLYWLKNQNGKATIASIQRNLSIGYNRAGRIMDSLQNLNCVGMPNPGEPFSKPLPVKLSMDEVEILFPKSLGWED